MVLGILAHVDAGKTTLSEAMLYTSGQIKSVGRVDHQNAYLDNDAQERQRGITIFSKQARMGDITLLDTPGHVDFSAEMERTLQVLDYAILVISGTDGVQGHTRTLWRLLRHYHIPTFLFINKMDLAGADHEAVQAQLKKELSDGCVDFTLEPYCGGGQPDEAFYEDLAVCKEELLTEYMDSGSIGQGSIVDAVTERLVFPCFYGSALKLEGVEHLLDALRGYTKARTYPRELAARVYKIGRDSRGVRLTYLKVTGGSLKVKERISYDGLEEKADQIRLYSGEKYDTADAVAAGEVCAVTGLTATYPGQGLWNEKTTSVPVLEPVLSYRIGLPQDVNPVEMMGKLKQLEEEDPQLHIIWNEELREIHAQMMGQVQIEVLTQLIKDRFGVVVVFGQGNIVYKETIAKPVEGVGHFEPLRHYAEVHLLMEPGEPGSGIEVASDCSEDILDLNWQRLIATHIMEREHPGVLTGSALTDVKITILTGRAHTKHTEGGDFRQATYRAVRQGLMMGECRLLEPVYAFRLEIPTEMTGRAMNDITRMHGRFAQPEIEGEMSILTGTAPVATMQEYQQDVTAYTRGQGKLSCTLQGYEPCHNEDEVLAASTYDPELDMANPASSVFCAHGAGYIVDWYDVYDMMHVKEDPGFALAGMEDVLRNITSEPTEADEDNRKRMARERQDAGAPVYDEKELEDIFVRTYGSNSRENAAYNKAGFNRRNKSVSEADWYVKKAAEHGKSKTAGAQTPSVGSKTADTGIARPGAYRKQKGEKEYLLVDGYNVIFAWDDLKALAAVNIDSARDKLIDVMSNYQGYVGCELILVFDAYKVKQNPGSITKHGNIHVVYTKEAETADMYIEKTTHELGRKYKVTVASSDGLEQLIIMGQGALRMSSRGLREEVERVNQILRNDYLK